MRFLKLIVMALSFAVFVGCGSEQTDTGKQAEATVESELGAYDIYLKNKEKSGDIPVRDERLVRHRQEKERLADAIVAEQLVDREKIEKAVAAYRADLVVNTYFNEALKQQTSAAAVREYYESNTDEFQRQRARFVRVGIPYGDELASKEQAFDQSMDAFRALSSDASNSDIGKDHPTANIFISPKDSWIELASLDESGRQAIQALQAGGVSKPLLTENEYVVFKLLESIQEETITFEQAADAIRFKLNNEIRIREKERLLGGN